MGDELVGTELEVDDLAARTNHVAAVREGGHQCQIHHDHDRHPIRKSLSRGAVSHR